MGAVRIRAIPAPAGSRPADGETHVWLEVSAEPRMQQFTISGDPILKRAIDELGQSLTAAPAAATPANPAAHVAWGRATAVYNPYMAYAGGRHQTVVLRLKSGEKRAKSLKDLSGTLSAQVLAPTEVLLKVDNVLKAAGKTVKGEHGGSLEFVSINKDDNGDYRVQIRRENAPGANPFGGAIQINGGGVIQINGGGVVQINGMQLNGNPAGQGMPVLLDKSGKAYQSLGTAQTSTRIANGTVTQEMTVLYRPNAGQGEPASLVVNGQRTIAVPVAFRLENVPLP
jgi:hypothetical protein